MKRIMTWILTLSLLSALLIPCALAADSQVSQVKLTYDLSVNGSNSVTVSPDSTVTVTFRIERTDSEEDYDINALQNEIIYDQDFFTFVEGSISAVKVKMTADEEKDMFQTRTTGTHIIKAADLQGSYSAEEIFCTFQLKVTASSGEGWVKCDRAMAFDNSGNAIEITEKNLIVRIASSSTSGIEENVPASYAVTVEDSDHGAVLCDPSARAGSTVTITPQPDLFYTTDSVTVTDKSGKSVAVKDNGDGTYSFVMPAGAVTVKVSFAHTYCPSEPYVDVIKSEWYHPAVDYVIEHEYFIGTSATTFEPNTVMTRAMFATVIARMAGFDETKYTTSEFDDVADGAWYTAAIAWASESGIVLGYGDGNFGPNDLITREQMATMLYRYTNYKQAVLPQTGVSLDTFPDSAEVSGWAKEAMEWATLSDLLHGTDEGLVEPLRGAKRAEMAQLLMNYDLALK